MKPEFKFSGLYHYRGHIISRFGGCWFIRPQTLTENGLTDKTISKRSAQLLIDRHVEGDAAGAIQNNPENGTYFMGGKL